MPLSLKRARCLEGSITNPKMEDKMADSVLTACPEELNSRYQTFCADILLSNISIALWLSEKVPINIKQSSGHSP
jgi:hypothetical protein